MSHKIVGVSVNSLVYFLFSFLIIKGILIFAKLVIATITGIDIDLVNYTLLGVSPANSPVWNFSSVLSFYSIELITLIILSIIAFIMYRRFRNRKGYIKMMSFWFFITSIVLFFSLISSGIFVRINVYHFFNWIYMSYSSMLVLALVILGVTAISGLLLNRIFLKFRPSLKEKRTKGFFMLLRSLFFTALFPVMIGLLLLYLPLVNTLSKYEFIEILTFLLFFFSGAVIFYKKPLKKTYSDILTKVNKPVMVSTLFFYVLFLVVIKINII